MKVKKRSILILTIISIVITIISAGYRFLLPYYLSLQFHTDLTDAAEIGIIGSADGPTSIYVGGDHSFQLIPLIFLIISIIGIVYLLVNRKKGNI